MKVKTRQGWTQILRHTSLDSEESSTLTDNRPCRQEATKPADKRWDGVFYEKASLLGLIGWLCKYGLHRQAGHTYDVKEVCWILGRWIILWLRLSLLYEIWRMWLLLGSSCADLGKRGNVWAIFQDDEKLPFTSTLPLSKFRSTRWLAPTNCVENLTWEIVTLGG